MSDARERLLQAGLIPTLTLEDDFARTMAADQKMVAELVRRAGIPLQ